MLKTKIIAFSGEEKPKSVKTKYTMLGIYYSI